MKFLKKCFSCCFYEKEKNNHDNSELEITDITEKKLNQDLINLKNINEVIKYEKGKKNKKVYTFESKIIEKIEIKNTNQYLKVIDVYDADTIKGIIFHRDIPIIISVRLAGIDTPEIKPKNSSINENKQEKALAIIAKIHLIKLINNCNNILYITTKGNDKFGRTLADIFISPNNKISINKILVNMRLADVYLGKTKEKNFKREYLPLDKSEYVINLYENNEYSLLEKYNMISKIYPLEDIIC